MGLKEVENKYHDSLYPVILTDEKMTVIFSNEFSKKNLMKFKKNFKLSHLLDIKNKNKLQNVIDTGIHDTITVQIEDKIDANLFTSMNCFAVCEETKTNTSNKIISLIFHPSLNVLSKKDKYDKEIKNILYHYETEKEKNMADLKKEIDNKKRVWQSLYNNHKKVQKIEYHISLYLKNVFGNQDSEAKNWCEVSEDIKFLKSMLENYTVSMGYRINCKLKNDKDLFLFKYNRWDFFTTQIIIFSFACRYSENKDIYWNFHAAGNRQYLLSIKFIPKHEIYEFLSKNITVENLAHSETISYIDLHIANLIAEKNEIPFTLQYENGEVTISTKFRYNQVDRLQSDVQFDPKIYENDIKKLIDMEFSF